MRHFTTRDRLRFRRVLAQSLDHCGASAALRREVRHAFQSGRRFAALDQRIARGLFCRVVLVRRAAP